MATKKRYLLPTCFFACALTFTLIGCTGKHDNVQNEEPATLSSVVRMGDPAVSSQLVSGFSAVENNTWRWTGAHFSVRLKTPPGAGQSGATLNLALTVPPVIIEKLGGTGVTASIGGMALKTEEYKTAGSYTFTADVPASMLTGDAVIVDFATSKSLPPGVDKRQLGVIATSVGLAPR